MFKFCIQLRLLLWKIWKQKTRTVLGFLFEIFLPVILISFLVPIKDLVLDVPREDTYGAGLPLVSDLQNLSFPETLSFLTCSVQSRWQTYDSSRGLRRSEKRQRQIAIAPDTPEVRQFYQNLSNFYDWSLQKIPTYHSLSDLTLEEWVELFNLVNIATDGEAEDLLDLLGVNTSDSLQVGNFLSEVFNVFEERELPSLDFDVFREIIEAVQPNITSLQEFFDDFEIDTSDNDQLQEFIDLISNFTVDIPDNAAELDELLRDVERIQNSTSLIDNLVDEFEINRTELVQAIYNILERNDWSINIDDPDIFRQDFEDLDDVFNGTFSDALQEFNLSLNNDNDTRVLIEAWDNLPDLIDFFNELNETQLEDFFQEIIDNNVTTAFDWAEEQGITVNSDVEQIFEDLQDNTNFDFEEAERVLEEGVNDTLAVFEEIVEVYEIIETLESIQEGDLSFVGDWLSDVLGLRRALQELENGDEEEEEVMEYCDGKEGCVDIVEGDGPCLRDAQCLPGLTCSGMCDSMARDWWEDNHYQWSRRDQCCKRPTGRAGQNCQADYGTALYGEPCCGMRGFVDDASMICPERFPVCEGYTGPNNPGGCVQTKGFYAETQGNCRGGNIGKMVGATHEICQRKCDELANCIGYVWDDEEPGEEDECRLKYRDCGIPEGPCNGDRCFYRRLNSDPSSGMTVQWQVLEIALLFAFLSVSPEQNPDVGALADLIEDMESTLNVSFPNGFDGEPTLYINGENWYSLIGPPDPPLCLETFDDAWKWFDSSKAIEDYVKNGDYGKTEDRGQIAGAIIIDDPTPGHVSYTVRVNRTSVPDTDGEYVDEYQTDPMQLYYRILQYLASGFLGLQNAIDQSILYSVNQDHVTQLGYHTFPSAAHIENRFWFFLKGLFPLFLEISFAYPFSVICKCLVEEKVSRVRSGMKIMGMSMMTYWISWLVFYTLMFAFSSTIMVFMVLNQVIEYTNKFLLWLSFVLFGAQMTTLSMFISTLFERPKISQVVAWASFLFIFYVFAFNSVSKGGLDVKIASCLSGPSCFALSMIQVAQYEDYQVGVQWSNLWELTPRTPAEIDGDFMFGWGLIMMTLDTFLYLGLTIYFDNVWPKSFGVRKPFYYPLLPIINWIWPEEDVPPLESMSDALRSQFVEERKGKADVRKLIEIRNLRKVFNGTGGKVVAVDGLSLDMYENECFCLIGHNGAGKTTTFNMLTGMLPVSNGDAIICGHSLVNNIEGVRQNIGLCPQFDFLFSTLTVKEHLHFYGTLAGLTGSALHEESLRLIEKVGLKEKIHCASKALSGGQKRKLSVCMALIGSNPIVILDEPTSGMDPYARRATWELIKENRKGRCIILTTHFMDEADILGDRIAMLSRGKLQCCGTSYFLKQLYSSGYEVVLTLKVGASKEVVSSFVRKYLPLATKSREAATELIFWTDFASNGLFPVFFAAIKQSKDDLGVESYGIQATTLENIFHQVMKGEVPTLSNPIDDEDDSCTSATLIDMGLRGERENSQSKETLGKMMEAVNAITSNNPDPDCVMNHPYATLESNGEVTSDKKNQLADVKYGEPSTVDLKNVNERPSLADFNKITTQTSPDGEISDSEMVKHASLEMEMIGTGNEPPQSVGEPPDDFANKPLDSVSMCTHLYQLLKKRSLTSFRDKQTYVCQLCLPLAFTLLSVVINFAWLVDQPRLDMHATTHYGDDNFIPFNCPNTSDSDPSWLHEYTDWLPEEHGQYGCYENDPYQMWSNIKNESYELTAMTYVQYPTWQDTLLDKRYNLENEEEVPRFLSLFLNQVVFDEYLVVGMNASGIHSLPVAMNLGANFLYRYLLKDPTATITTHSHPLPLTGQELFFQDTFNDMFAMIILVIAFCFVPSATLAVIVGERVTQVKHMQLMSGIKLWVYWISNYIWDVFTITLASGLCVFIASSFGTASMKDENILPAVVLCLLFAWSVTPFTYIFSRIFAGPATAQGLFLLFELTASVLMMIATFILRAFEDTQKANDILMQIGYFLPPYCMGDCFRNLSLRSIGFIWGGELSPWHWRITGRNFVYMGGSGLCYFLILLFLEYRALYSCNVDPKIEEVYEQTDDDIVNEKNKIRAGERSEDLIQLHGLQKIYRSNVGLEPVVAVQDLWFSVPKGQVFGFLGLNGAGKSTTMKILSGVVTPTLGNAYINGSSISNQVAVRKQIGYCPQENALFTHLTVKETMDFFHYVRGYSSEQTERMVNKLIDDLSLTDFAKTQANNLSGGNKRKLSLGVAVTGRPKVLLLDEPSSGMDPVSKRFMWNYISEDLRHDCAIMLTTHSMEECEALSQRIGIMANGEMVCIGTQQRLKSRFGGDFQLDVKLSEENPEVVEEITKFLQDPFQKAELLEDYGLTLRYEVNVGDLDLDVIFRYLEDCKEQFKILENYAISQTSLEAIFIKIAQQSRLQLRGKRNILDCLSYICRLD